jgi:hypothetical protein
MSLSSARQRNAEEEEHRSQTEDAKDIGHSNCVHVFADVLYVAPRGGHWMCDLQGSILQAMESLLHRLMKRVSANALSVVASVLFCFSEISVTTLCSKL